MAKVYTVAEGDTMSKLAHHFYGDAGLFRVIAAANGIVDPDVIDVGQVLTIPDVTRRHTVAAGDTLSELAQEFYGDSVFFPVIAAANGIVDPDVIEVGRVLSIPEPELAGAPGQAAVINILPYASEPFGVYQPLIGWRSTLQQERLAHGLANRFMRAADLVRAVTAMTQDRPVPKLEPVNVMDPTGTGIGQALANRVRAGRSDADTWHALLADASDSALTVITKQVLAPLQQPATAAPHMEVALFANRQQVEGAEVRQISREAATAALLQHLGANNPQAVAQLFKPELQPWQRALASVEFFAEDHPAKQRFLSPIGILHRFREYFFELGTFLGPPVGHVWLSPGGTVEVIEVNTRRTMVDRTVEQSTQTTAKSELEQTDRDELADAVKVENANDTKLGATVTASGGVGKVYQASGSASFNLDSSRKQAQEQTHKRMREQSSKLSSEVQQNYKTTFRTVTESTDTSSRRYVLQNTTERLVSYELSRKMRKVAVQVQDLGQQLCWQLYVDNPGTALDTGEFVHETAAALDPGKQPDHIPYPEDKPVTYSLALPFNQTHGGDDDTEDTYELRGDTGVFKPKVGDDNIIQFKFKIALPPAPESLVLDHLSNIDFHGAQVAFSDPHADPGLQPNPNIADNSFQLQLTHANFDGKKQIPFDVTFVYRAPQSVRDDIDAKNKAAVNAYNDEVAAKKEQSFYETLRKRLKLSGQVRPRASEDLREEERTVIYRTIISRLYGKETGWSWDDYHVASELIRYFFDIDAMLYFVAPDWWRPRVQPLASMNQAGEIQATTVVDPRTMGLGSAQGHHQHYLFTEETTPAPMGASLGWFIELDGDSNRNAFLNSPWVKAVLPIQPGREKEAIAFLKRTEVAGTDGLQEPYPFDPTQDPPEYAGLNLEEVLLRIADKIAVEQQQALTPVPVNPDDVNSKLALPPETVFEKGFDPLAGGIKFGSEPFRVFSQWTEILPTDQVVATEYSLKGLN